MDLAHNFVLADTGCNAGKSDFLPDVPFLEKWVRRNDDHRAALADGFAKVHAPHDLDVSIQITAWAYEQVERSGGRVWAGGRSYRPLGTRWRGALSNSP